MNDLNNIFEQAKVAMLSGKDEESKELLKKAASLGHLGAIQALQNLEFQYNLTKKFPVNPLLIVDDEKINLQHRIPNLVKLYEQDVLSNLGRLQSLNNGLIPDEIVELLVYQTISNFIEYKNKSGILPLAVVYEVKTQIKQAFENIYIDRGYMKQIVEEYEAILPELIWKKDIIEDTEAFMEKLDNKYFM